jgi:hypothetical protein
MWRDRTGPQIDALLYPLLCHAAACGSQMPELRSLAFFFPVSLLYSIAEIQVTQRQALIGYHISGVGVPPGDRQDGKNNSDVDYLSLSCMCQ